MEKWLKRLWLINGVLLLVVLIAMIQDRARSFFRETQSRPGPLVGKKIEKALADSLALQDISFGIPRTVGTTQYCVIHIVSKDLATPTRITESERYVRIAPSWERNVLRIGGTINLLFAKQDGSEPRLLLDRKALITSSDIPSEGDSLQGLNLYRIVIKDTDNDGRLTHNDRSDLYVSDLNGQNLRQITGDKLNVLQYRLSMERKKIFIHAQLRPADQKISRNDWQDTLVVYDLVRQQLSPFLADDSLFHKARKLSYQINTA